MKNKIKTDLTRDEKFHFLAISEKIVKSAGKHILSMTDSGKSVKSEIGCDIKISADEELDNIISNKLTSEINLPILSEESSNKFTDDSFSGFYWVVDPVDGSMNYSRSLDLCCIAVALWFKDKPVLGVIYDFNRNELYSGICGIGAWINAKDIFIGECKDASKAVLATGFPLLSDLSRDSVAIFLDVAGRYKKVRMLGTAALSLAFVSCGKIDLYWERDIMIWDVAAGLAILQAAGGEYLKSPGRAKYTWNVFAGNRTLISDGRDIHGF